MNTWEFVHWRAYRKFNPFKVDLLNWGLANVADAIATFSINRPEQSSIEDWFLDFDPKSPARLKRQAEREAEEQRKGAIDNMLEIATRITKQLGGTVAA